MDYLFKAEIVAFGQRFHRGATKCMKTHAEITSNDVYIACPNGYSVKKADQLERTYREMLDFIATLRNPLDSIGFHSSMIYIGIH